MHSCLPQFYSVALCSCFSHDPALVHALLLSKLSNIISLLGLCQSYYINSLLLPAKTRNISVIFSFRCEVCSTLQGHFALPVYLQDFYFPFTSKHFFLDLESSFGSFRRCSNAAHPGSSAVTNPCAPGAGWRCRAPGPGIPRCCSAACSPHAPHTFWGASRLSGPFVVIPSPMARFRVLPV